MRFQRKYSDQEKATALTLLKANNHNVFQTAIELKIPRKTLEHWSKETDIHPDLARTCLEKQGELDALFEEVARKYLGQASDPFVVSSTAGKDAVIAAATATDKMRLIRDQPTAINANVRLNDEERSARVTSIFDRARSRKAS